LYRLHTHRESDVHTSWLPTSSRHVIRHTKTQKRTIPSPSVSRSIKASQGSVTTHCSGTEGHWWPGQIVSEPRLPGWTQSLLIYISLILAAPLRLNTGDKRAAHMPILHPKTDWSHSTQIPAEERHYYLCSGAQWHISKRQCGGQTKSLGECVSVCFCLCVFLSVCACLRWLLLHSGSLERKENKWSRLT